MRAATVIIPTFDHGPTLLRSIPSALAQTVDDIEVFVIGDGVPDVTRQIVGDFEGIDRRVRFFDNPKGPRHGEIHRHAALREATGRIVCYLSDDDLWLPEHVESMAVALDGADFACAPHVEVSGQDGMLRAWLTDVSMPLYRKAVLESLASFAFSCMAHTLEMYRRLPFGWRTTPKDTYTDLYMYQQFLSQPDCRARTSALPTLVHFPSPQRVSWTLDQRLEEMDRWVEALATQEERQKHFLRVLEAVLRDTRAATALDEMVNSITWRLRTRLVNVPLASGLLRAVARMAAGPRVR